MMKKLRYQQRDLDVSVHLSAPLSAKTPRTYTMSVSDRALERRHSWGFFCCLSPAFDVMEIA